jgi:ABC-2 type transport system permease protein
MTQLMRIAAAFCYRDFTVYARWLPGFIYSYSIQYPLLYGLCFGYLLPKIGMGSSAIMCVSVMAIGTILYALFTAGFGICSEFLMDFEKARTIDFKMQFMPIWLIIVQKMVFNAAFIFASCVLYIPMLKLLFYSDFDISQISWLSVYAMLAASCLFIAAFQICFACAISSRKSIRHLWRRVNYPMIIFGGFLVPWKPMNNFSSIMGCFGLLNPITYITEGLRRAVLGLDSFFPVSYCLVALLVATGVCVLLSIVLLRRKIDAV